MSMNYSGSPGSYTYSQNRLGKTAYGIVVNGKRSSRDPKAQKNAGGQARQPGDHGGHLIAHSIGGRNDASNLDAQAADVNQHEQRTVERMVSKMAEDPGKTVSYHVSNYNSVGERPEATIINVGVRNNVTGKVEEEAHFSFENASHELQESWNHSVDEYASEIDPLQDVGMTSEEREMANELCGAEDTVDMSLGAGCIYKDFDETFLDGGEVRATDALHTDENLGEESREDSDEKTDDHSGGNEEEDGLEE